jgi:hypothetical protein
MPARSGTAGSISEQRALFVTDPSFEQRDAVDAAKSVFSETSFRNPIYLAAGRSQFSKMSSLTLPNSRTSSDARTTPKTARAHQSIDRCRQSSSPPVPALFKSSRNAGPHQLQVEEHRWLRATAPRGLCAVENLFSRPISKFSRDDDTRCQCIPIFRRQTRNRLRDHALGS